ncbi:MAG: hypothetical protein PHN78_05145 [Dehalococcoidales bacterium]|nr:hypothetical protein [Dehalococcoidales bacterium]
MRDSSHTLRKREQYVAITVAFLHARHLSDCHTDRLGFVAGAKV